MTGAPSVVHVIVTDNFAGAERYVCDVASETASRGWRVTVVGGRPDRMQSELGSAVAWHPGATITQALRSIVTAGRHDVCHVHMTLGEAAGALTRRTHGGLLVATRHFAARRGSSVLGRLLAPWLARAVDRQIAISQFVDRALEGPADAVLLNGTGVVSPVWSPSARRVLVLQRLEPEKNTGLALEAWRLSGLDEAGWSLRLCGDGSHTAQLRQQADDLGLAAVEFAGYATDVQAEFAAAGILLATASAEPLGLSVIEAMAAGVPAVAAAGGGHLETVGQVPDSVLFPPGDAPAAAAALVRLAASDVNRAAQSVAGRRHHAAGLTCAAHVDRLLASYQEWGVR